MKSFFLLSATLFSVLITNAQNKTGIFFGPQATAARYTVLDQKQKNELRYGFQAGVNMKIPFEGNLYFAPAVFYSLKGYNVTFTNYAFPPDVTAKDNRTTLHNFETAAMLQYDLGKKPAHFFIKAGPSIDFQMAGKENFNLQAGGSVKQSMKFSYGDYGRFSANMIGQFGYETIDGFMVFAQYSLGLANINNADNGPTIKHRVFGISIGKYFKKKK